MIKDVLRFTPPHPFKLFGTYKPLFDVTGPVIVKTLRILLGPVDTVLIEYHVRKVEAESTTIDVDTEASNQ